MSNDYQNYNIRQFNLMLGSISSFEENKIDLPSLQSTLEFLYAQLKDFHDSNWKEIFCNAITTLESINAGIPNGFEIKKDTLATDAIYILKAIINKYLREYLESPDINISQFASILDAKWLFCPSCLDAWESESTQAMVICPKCNNAFHNPRYKTS